MRKVAPDVERLMWLIAEGRDPKAISDFEARFPDLKADLAKHISMVSGLKRAGKQIPRHEIPRFTPLNAVARPAPRRTVYLVAAVGLAAVAYGAFSITNALITPPQNRELTPIKHEEASTKPGILVPPITPPANTVTPTNPETSPSGSPSGSQNPPTADAPISKLITVKGKLPLQAAIVEICRLGGITAEFPPSFPVVEVEMDFRGVPAMDAIQILGEKYGFTALPQEPGNILVLPVKRDGDRQIPIPRETDGGQSPERSEPPQGR
jgi:hypothetical protein